ncbi:MAG: hypothetical protein NC336_06990 [Clostridium sp.]|nr:hypothetical protein [Clostridium sp.]
MKQSFTLFAPASVAMAMMATTAGASVRVPVSQSPVYETLASTKAVEEETFVSIGKGTYRDNFVQSWWTIPVYPETEVEIFESTTTPGRYRVMNPYRDYPSEELFGSPGVVDQKDYYITIDASDPVHVFIETSHTGFEVGGGQELVIGSIADDYYNNRYGNWILADREGVCGKIVDGEITFPPNSLIVFLQPIGEPEIEDPLWLQTNGAGMFRVKLPGAPDLDIDIELAGINDDHTELTYTLLLGESIEFAKVALVEGDYSDETADEIKDGTIASTEVRTSGSFVTPYVGDGNYTLYAIPYLEGTPRKITHLTHDIAYDESEWRKCGQALFHEAIVGSPEYHNQYFFWQEDEYLVEIEENRATPGIVRLVNPYGSGYRYYTPDEYDSSHNHYLVINGADPNAVYIEYADDLGLDFGYDWIKIWSRAARSFEQGFTKEDIAAEGTFGKYENYEFTFPKASILLMFSPNPTGWYGANQSGNTSLKVSPGQIVGGTATAIGTISGDDNDSTERYYTVGGVELRSLDGAAPGVYIVRRGSATEKRVVR